MELLGAAVPSLGLSLATWDRASRKSLGTGTDQVAEDPDPGRLSLVGRLPARLSQSAEGVTASWAPRDI